MCVYTAITNGYDEPRTDVKCFTEYDRFHKPVLNAKIYKCLPHLFMPDEKITIWVDGNLELKDGAEEALIRELGDEDVLVFANPYRNFVSEEVDEIKRLKLDTEDNIDATNYNFMDRLPACFLIVRRNIARVKRMNERWWAEICHGSTRDQISFSKCFPHAKVLPRQHPFDNIYFKRYGHKIPRRQVDPQ